MTRSIQTTLWAAVAVLLAGPLTRPAGAVAPPQYPNFRVAWSDAFAGAGGSLPDGGRWNVVTGSLGVNNELQTYTASGANVGLTGVGTLVLVPRRDGSAAGGWTSGRIESTYTFTPKPGGRTAVEGSMRYGSAPGGAARQGMWAAFWMEGASIREGTTWPANGELDIMETVNGALTGYGTAHCTLCHESGGIGGNAPIPDYGWHTWRTEWALEPADWRAQSITWLLDGKAFFEITGDTIGDEQVWNTLAHNEMFIILDLAVGGNWVSSSPSYTHGLVRL